MTEASGPEKIKNIYKRLISEKKNFMQIAEYLGTDGKTAYYYILEHGLLPDYRKSLRKRPGSSLSPEQERQRIASLERCVTNHILRSI